MSSSDDTAELDFNEETGTLNVILPDWLLLLKPLASIMAKVGLVGAVIVALTNMRVERVRELLVEENKHPITVLVDDWLFDTVLLPLGARIFAGFLNAINEFIVLMFGTDRIVGVAPGHRPGLVDLPLVIINPLATAAIGTGFVVFEAVDTFNRGLAGGLEGIGLAAPTVVNVLWAAELTAIGAVLWFAVSFIPFFNARGILLSVTTIPRRILNRLL